MLHPLQYRIQVPRQKIRHADTPRQSLVLDLLHRLPRPPQPLLIPIGKERLVDQIQIHVLQPQLLQAGPDRPRDVRDVGAHLGRHEELLARDPGLRDGGAELGLGVVDLGAVEVVVVERDGRLDAGDEGRVRLGVVGLFEPRGPRAVGEHGDGGAVGEFEIGDGSVDFGHVGGV